MPGKLIYSDLLDRQFEFGGRGPDRYDCWGLQMELCRRLGRYLPRSIVSCSDRGEIHERITKWTSAEFVRIADPTPYCLVTLSIRPPWVSHIGMVLNDLFRFIHISRSTRVCVERLDHPMWHKRIDGYWEHVTWRTI